MSTTEDDHLDDLRERLFSRDHLGANNALFDAIELGVDAEPLVVELLEHVNVYRQPIVAAALGDARKPGPADEALRSLLSGSGPHTADVRCAALVSLAKRLGPDATEDFVGALRGPSAVRAYALTCLAAVGDDRGWEQVYGLLADVLRRPQESRGQPSASVTSAVLYLASRARSLSGRSDRLMSLIRSRWSHLGHEDQDWLREYWRGFDPAEPEARDVEPPADLLAKFAASPLFTGRAIRRHGPEIAPGAEVVPDPHEPRLVPLLGEASEAVPYELADFGMSQLDLVSLDALRKGLYRAPAARAYCNWLNEDGERRAEQVLSTYAQAGLALDGDAEGQLDELTRFLARWYPEVMAPYRGVYWEMHDFHANRLVGDEVSPHMPVEGPQASARFEQLRMTIAHDAAFIVAACIRRHRPDLRWMLNIARGGRSAKFPTFWDFQRHPINEAGAILRAILGLAETWPGEEIPDHLARQGHLSASTFADIYAYGIAHAPSP